MAENIDKIRNLGLMAHVDAGKTTLTENMLFQSGRIKSAGNVDKGASQTDYLEVEKKRGISVRASSVYFNWKDVRINLIDTPGHIDFSAEVERSIRVMDCAVLLLSAVEGIQAQSSAIWNALKELNIPTIIFINKIDRVGSDTTKLINDIRKEFSNDLVMLNKTVNEGSQDAGITDVYNIENEELTEAIAEKDDILLEKYLNSEKIELDQISGSLKKSVLERKIFPIIFGVVKNNTGVDYLLDRIIELFPDAPSDTKAPPSGLVFSIEHDDRLGRVAGVRLFSGTIITRDIIKNHTAGRDEKISQIRKKFSNKLESVPSFSAGDIAWLCGMPEVRIGDILGSPESVPGLCSIAEPLLSVQVLPENDADYLKLAEALQMLSSEDPTLNFEWFREERQLQLKIMGAIQTEIITEQLNLRFGIAARFTDPEVIYKETPSGSGLGIERYTMPKPCWAVIKLLIEPGKTGSGIIYKSELSTDYIHRKYQNEVEVTIPQAIKQGIKGWEVTDMKVTLVDGEDHVMHSNPGDFKLATPIALMKGLTETGTNLLEPILSFKIIAPDEFLGRITGDIINMRGSFEPAMINNGIFELVGKVPLASSMDYSIRLSSLTGGRTKYTVRLSGYEKCPQGEGKTREYKGISPLDRSKYILKMRGAINQK